MIWSGPSRQTLTHSFSLCTSHRTNPICGTFKPYSTRDSHVKSVAILGGGISGLAAAFYLATMSPGLPITIFESSARLGGWIRTRNFLTNLGPVNFETGPRTLRLGSSTFIVIADLIRHLRLGDQLVLLPRHSKAVKNRFIYYPDRIVPIPSDYASWMDTNTSKIFEGLWKGLFAEPFRKRRPVEVIDESVGSFVSRRVHPKVSQNLVSAVLHGIYAGDVDRLSMRSVFPLVYKDELEYGSFTMGVLKRWFSRKSSLTKYEQQLLHDLVPLNRTLLAFLASEDAAMLSFAGGMETLVHALSWSLNKFPNVRIKRKSTVKSISRGSHPHTPMQVQLATNHPPSTFSHIISTLPAPVTSSLLPVPIAPLSFVEAVTVQVVNLYYMDPTLSPISGFGYLIPKSVSPELNPEQALGVIFDSKIEAARSLGVRSGDAPGTKFTVLMGGHYWNGRTTYPTEAEAVTNALNLLERHLGIVDLPAHFLVSTQTNSIPQYTVGHHERMSFAHELLKINFDGKLAVAGSSYKGVGVSDCVASAYSLVGDLLAMGTPWETSAAGEWTGLRSFVED